MILEHYQKIFAEILVLTKIKELKVYNQLGTELLHQTNLGLSGQFSTLQWSNGIYFVQIKGVNNTLEIHKLVVMH